MKLPLRQVHLDFHTSPDIPGIGSRFDKKQFQKALKAGHLDSITVFAKCHHGLCYYPTQVGTMHPGLDFDLTGAMIEAAHEIGVRAPVYITAGWSDLDAKQHPEWICLNKDGSQSGSPGMLRSMGRDGNAYREEVAWDTLCISDGSYCQHIYKLTEEVCKRYSVLDGLFYDICFIGTACYCPDCVAGMKQMGMDPQNEEDAKRYYILKRRAFMEKCGQILHSYHPEATIFFNSGGASIYKPEFHDMQSHFEMEDLPTAWDGYDKMPMRAKYFNRTGKFYLGMTGKFHLAWGEFGGFKCKEALKFEISAMAMYGAGCSVGDHMHPDGEMELQTYENIGYAYEYLDRIAPFCYGGSSTARLGVVISDTPGVNMGISKILLENQIDFEVVDGDYQRFEAVIVPENVCLDDASVEALQSYVAAGGKLLFCGNSLVKNGRFLVDCGADYVGESLFDCDYIFTDAEFSQELPKAPMLCNLPGYRVEQTDGLVIAKIMTPYFSRTMDRFCGHKNTPHDKSARQLPGIIRKDNVVYMAHPMASAYNKYGSLYQKRYFMLALEQLFEGGAFRISGMGSMGRATMIRQGDHNRYCLNLLYGSPVMRGCAEIIEDLMPVYDIKVQLSIPETVKKAWLGVTGEELSVLVEDGKQTIVIPKLQCHASLILEF